MANSGRPQPLWLTVAGLALPIVGAVIVSWVNLRESVARVEVRIDEMHSSFQTFRDDLTTFRGDLNTFRERLTSFENLLRQAERLPPDFDRFQQQVNRLESMLSQLRGEHRGLEQQLTHLRATVAPPGLEPIPVGFYLDVTTRLRRIEERLDSIAVKVGVARGPVGSR